MSEIVTEFWLKPIPTDKYDWSAWYAGTEEDAQMGHGATEQEAIDDLKHNYGEDQTNDQ